MVLFWLFKSIFFCHFLNWRSFVLSLLGEHSSWVSNVGQYDNQRRHCHYVWILYHCWSTWWYQYKLQYNFLNPAPSWVEIYQLLYPISPTGVEFNELVANFKVLLGNFYWPFLIIMLTPALRLMLVGHWGQIMKDTVGYLQCSVTNKRVTFN